MISTGNGLKEHPEEDGFKKSVLLPKAGALRGDLLHNTFNQPDFDQQSEGVKRNNNATAPPMDGNVKPDKIGFKIPEPDLFAEASKNPLPNRVTIEKAPERKTNEDLPLEESRKGVEILKKDDKEKMSLNKRIVVFVALTVVVATLTVAVMLYLAFSERNTGLASNSEISDISSSEIYKKTSPAIAVIEVMLSDGSEVQGSGFFIDDEGTLVTNYHVIDEAVAGRAAYSSGSKYEIVGVKDCDEILDLAILEVSCRNNPFLRISGRRVQTGERIYTLGAPLGLDDTFSDGIVSNASRVIDGVRCIQITAPISPGNSGGPLINSEGDVIGVNTFVYTNGQNLNFAVDIRELEKLKKGVGSEMTLRELNEKKHFE